MTAHNPHAFDRAAAQPLRYLLIPGLNDSGPDHWQTRWQQCRDDCARIELGDWASPTRIGWTLRIGEAVEASPDRVVLVGHSLGCLAIIWWAAQAPAFALAKVAGAMLVAPPDVGQQGCDLRLLRFAPLPGAPLPFPALVVASEDDCYASLSRSRALADSLRANLVNVGQLGHINGASNLGNWAEGQALLELLPFTPRC